MAFVIEKGVPFPEREKRTFSKYPFGEMKIGDSFFIKKDDPEYGKVRSSASYYGKRNDRSFSSRTYGSGIRIWRVK